MRIAESEPVCGISDRAAWIEARRNGIGGSDAGPVVGVSQWKTPLHVYFDKAEGEDRLPSEAMYWGNVLEPVVAKEYEKRTGESVFKVTRMFRHRDVHIVQGTPDFWGPGANGGISSLLEIKVVGPYMRDQWGHPGSDQVPDDVICQCQQYLGLFPVDFISVAALFAGNELGIFRVGRDQTFIDRLFSNEVAFWEQHVLPRIPPEPDLRHASTEDLLKRLYPGSDGTRISLSDDAAAANRKLQVLKAAKARLEKKISEHTNRIKAEMKEAAVGDLPGGGHWTRKVVQRKGYTVSDTEYVDARFKARVEEE